MHQLVLYSIANLTISGSKYSRLEGMENGFLFSGEVYEEYDNVCRKIGKRARSTRWYREYLSDLEILGLISTMPSGRGLRGQTTLIKCGSNPQDISEVLKSTLYS
jgi:cell division control protein 6